MKKIFGFIFIMIFLFSLGFVAAHGKETFSQAEEIIKIKVSCSDLTDLQLEILGDYYMEQMHPGEAHERMDEMMGGEGSESLREMHINMGKVFYCGEHGGVGDMTEGHEDMHEGGMDHGMMENMDMGMMGGMHGGIMDGMNEEMRESEDTRSGGGSDSMMGSGGMGMMGIGGGMMGGMMSGLVGVGGSMMNGLSSMNGGLNSMGGGSSGNYGIFGWTFMVLLMAGSVLLVVFLVKEMHVYNQKDERRHKRK